MTDTRKHRWVGGGEYGGNVGGSQQMCEKCDNCGDALFYGHFSLLCHKPSCDLKAQLDQAQKENERLKQELGEKLEHDRTKVAEAITAMEEVFGGRAWLGEGRGCYQWDDDRWHDEFKATAEEIRQAYEPLKKIASDQLDCPTNPAEIAKARVDLKAELKQMTEALEKLVHQIEISNAIDDHGHDLKNLVALHDAKAALKLYREGRH